MMTVGTQMLLAAGIIMIINAKYRKSEIKKSIAPKREALSNLPKKIRTIIQNANFV